MNDPDLIDIDHKYHPSEFWRLFGCLSIFVEWYCSKEFRESIKRNRWLLGYVT